jgi:hypothetical protein
VKRQLGKHWLFQSATIRLQPGTQGVLMVTFELRNDVVFKGGQALAEVYRIAAAACDAVALTDLETPLPHVPAGDLALVVDTDNQVQRWTALLTKALREQRITVRRG